MPRFARRPLIAGPIDFDRKEIERRAREATQPAMPEKKKCWPFSINDASDAPAAAADEQASRTTPDASQRGR